MSFGGSFDIWSLSCLRSTLEVIKVQSFCNSVEEEKVGIPISEFFVMLKFQRSAENWGNLREKNFSLKITCTLEKNFFGEKIEKISELSISSQEPSACENNQWNKISSESENCFIFSRLRVKPTDQWLENRFLFTMRKLQALQSIAPLKAPYTIQFY